MCGLYEKIVNAPIQPILLKRQLETNHSDKMNRDQRYFLQLGENIKHQHMNKTGQIQQKGAEIVRASYEIAFLKDKTLKAVVVRSV